MDGHAPLAGEPSVPPVRSSELLGFPPEARVLIVNCDDLGMYPAINSAVFDAIDNGIAGSCSLMVPCPGAPDALRTLARRPEIPFGVHLTLVRDSAAHRWGPAAGRDRVPSLLDGRGELFTHTPAHREALLSQARVEEVEREFRAQIEVVMAAGLVPTHLDFHCLADAGRADLLDLAVGLAGEYGVAVRVWLDAGRARVRARGLPVVDNDFLDSFSLALDGKAERCARLLAELPPGLSEWAVHPGLGGPEVQDLDGGWRVRRTDHAFLTSARARALLDEYGVTVIDYRTLQPLWTRKGAGNAGT